MLTAEAHYRKGEYSQASNNFDIYAQKHHFKPPYDVVYRMGYAQYRAGNQQKAIDNFKKIASLDDSLGRYASFYLGAIYADQGNKPFAKRAFEKAAKGPKAEQIKASALLNLAKVNYELNDYSTTIDNLNDFITLYPSDKQLEDANDLLSQAYLNTNNYSLAIEHIEKLPSKSPKIKDTYQKVTFYQGTKYFDAGKHSQAAKMFNKSLTYQNDKEITRKAHFWLGETQSIAGQHDDAINAYANVFTVSSSSDSEHLNARYGIGYAYYNTEQYDRALAHFQAYTSALEGQQRKRFYDDAILRLADCYYVNKGYSNAVIYYDKVLNSKNPDKGLCQFPKGCNSKYTE